MPSHADEQGSHVPARLAAATRPPIGPRAPGWPGGRAASLRAGLGAAPGGRAPRERLSAIAGVGVDLLEIARLARELERDGAGFLRQVFRPAEVAYCEAMRYPARHLAARFAAKEAVFKALGLRRIDVSAWRDVEIRSRGDGSRRVVLHGRLGRLAARRGVRRAWLSMTHTRSLAAASVILES